MGEDEVDIGTRIAVERKLRKLTQEELARAACISTSLLRKVESGAKPATSGTVAAVARALRIEGNRLTGQPYEPAAPEERQAGPLAGMGELRGELISHGLPPDSDSPAPSLDELTRRVAEVALARHGADYGRLSVVLPSLLEDLRRGWWEQPDEAGRERVSALLSETYDAASIHAHALGHGDVATLAAMLTERTAEESGDPLRAAVGRGLRASYLTRAGKFDAGRAATLRAVRDLVEQPDSAPAWSVWGFLQLQAALAAARAGDSADTWEHYRNAEDAARRVGSDRDDYRRAFGPSNVGIWGVGLAVELMDGPEALERARRVRIPRTMPAERAGHHWLDVARGCIYADKPQKAVGALATAKRIAPDLIRHHPMARETLYAAARAERRSSETLLGLAEWMGVHV